MSEIGHNPLDDFLRFFVGWKFSMILHTHAVVLSQDEGFFTHPATFLAIGGRIRKGRKTRAAALNKVLHESKVLS